MEKKIGKLFTNVQFEVFYLPGIYAMPMDVVAEALFDALMEFDTNKSERSTLMEIHIVDINSDNIRIIHNTLYCKFRQFHNTT